MEEMRDDKIGKIIIWMQSRIRNFLVKKKYKPMKEQRLALEVIQRTLRSYVKLRCWPWWSFWRIIKPTLKVVCIADEIKKFEDKLAKATEILAEEETARKQVESKSQKLQKEKENVQKQLDDLRALGSDFGDKIQRLQQQKQELDNQVNVRSKIQSSQIINNFHTRTYIRIFS